jgi:hypothetical protein
MFGFRVLIASSGAIDEVQRTGDGEAGASPIHTRQ